MPHKRGKRGGKPTRGRPRLRLKPPSAVRLTADAVPLTQARTANQAIPEWVVWAIMDVNGTRTKAKWVATGMPVTTELECVVAPPPWAAGVAVGYFGPNHPIYLPAVCSPVLLIPGAKPDPEKGHYPTGPHVIQIPE